MGNCMNCTAGEAPAGKLLLLDGTYRSLEASVTVAELMLDHPSHFIFELRRPLSGHACMPQPLPADHELDPHKFYAVLPFNGDEAHEEARRRLSGNGSFLRWWCFPVNSCGLMSSGEEEEEEEYIKVRCSTEVMNEKARLMRGRRGWKPSLGTIQERA
ncbi:uncharacterized protein LOC120273736 [Dioscorea cayenensis subsp. rotundata]|uniref:Uncharacterized protein LOC120273736 n=1 Tax=Dioscorea cayennensis subsp. rotundata TaxID=55577 RepID=A0AB40CAH8_DIOCR|nr:uncharacterized protein LOC120273736 [Dioscorea cayenensis subsp. rotundata]